MKTLLISISLILTLSSCKDLDCSANTDKLESYMMNCIEQCKNCSWASDERKWYDRCSRTATEMFCEYKEKPKAY